MNLRTLSFSVGLLFSMNLISQQPNSVIAITGFGLKGDVIGETLADFRNHNTMPLDKGPGAPYPRCSGDSLGEKPKLPTNTSDKQAWDKFNDAAIDETLQVILDGRVPEAVKLGADKVCLNQRSTGSGNGTVAGFDASVSYYFLDGRLDRIEGAFSSDHYESIVKAIGAKYGTASEVSVKSYQNRMGASYSGEVRSWRSPIAVMQLTEVSSVDDISSISIFNPETVRRMKEAEDKKAADSL